MLVLGHLWCLCMCTAPEAALMGFLGPCFPQNPWGVGSGKREGCRAWKKICRNPQGLSVGLVSKAELPKPGSKVESSRDGDNVSQIFGCHKSSRAPLAWICTGEELDNSRMALLVLSKNCQMKMGVKGHHSPGLRHFSSRFGLALLANTG